MVFLVGAAAHSTNQELAILYVNTTHLCTTSSQRSMSVGDSYYSEAYTEA